MSIAAAPVETVLTRWSKCHDHESNILFNRVTLAKSVFKMISGGVVIDISPDFFPCTSPYTLPKFCLIQFHFCTRICHTSVSKRRLSCDQNITSAGSHKMKIQDYYAKRYFRRFHVRKFSILDNQLPVTRKVTTGIIITSWTLHVPYNTLVWYYW